MTNGASASNEAQIEYWNGRAGERWASEQEAHDASLEPFGNAILAKAAAQSGERALDVGCGTGTTTLILAQAVGESGTVSGIDVSAPMLARAKQRGKSLENVTFDLADAAVTPFASTHDLVFSRFGVMFFADPTAAFENLRGALKNGGRLAFVCWRKLEENPWMDVPLQVAAAVVGFETPGDPHAPGPMAFADSTRLATILATAGFDDILIQPFDADFVMSRTGIEDAVASTMKMGPAARVFAEATDEQKKKLPDALRAALTPHAKGQVVALPAATWLVTATNNG